MQARPEVRHHFFMAVGFHSTLGVILQSFVDFYCPCGIPRRLIENLAIVGLEAPVQRFQELLSILVAKRERVLQQFFDRHGHSLAHGGPRCWRKKSIWTCSRAKLSFGSGTMCVDDSVISSARLPAT